MEMLVAPLAGFGLVAQGGTVSTVVKLHIVHPEALPLEFAGTIFQ